MVIESVKVVKETEKALLVSTFVGNRAGNERVIDFWFPKSQVKISGNELETPGWLASKKIEELEARGGVGGLYFSRIA